MIFPSIIVKGSNKGGETAVDDLQIIDLYWARAEAAITETEKIYGRYCHSIAYHILCNEEDSEECVSDTYLKAWNSIPPQRPSALKLFLGKITRNLSLDRYEQRTAGKRGYGEIPLVLDELQGCVPAMESTERIVEDIALVELFDKFLAELSAEGRRLFVLRYWHLYSIREIAAICNLRESKVKMSLMRNRNKLRQLLEKEGITP
jgi:RNA polymerase sigma-70 factor (ECF subfamily)